jgi:hypothetical protein
LPTLRPDDSTYGNGFHALSEKSGSGSVLPEIAPHRFKIPGISHSRTVCFSENQSHSKRFEEDCQDDP